MNTNSHLDGYTKIAAQDFTNDKTQLALAYLIRIIGAVVFALLFMGIMRLIRPDLPADLTSYISISVEGAPAVVSYVLVALSVVVVLSLHELVHASVYWFDQRIPPMLGWRGLTIFAAAPGYLCKRPVMRINALAPFVVISLVGIVLMAFLPVGWLPWIFIPTVVNAAAAGGDFMTAIWLQQQPSDALFEDNGDVITSYRRNDT